MLFSRISRKIFRQNLEIFVSEPMSALRAEISCVPTKSIFRLCSQGRQKINHQ